MIRCDYDTTLRDGTIIVKTYSDAGFMVKQVETDVLYAEAADIGEKVGDDYKPKRYTYVETDIPIEEPEEPNEEEIDGR